MNNLRVIREQKNISQCQLALLSGVSNGTISQFETGVRQPWPKARRAISEALNVPESEVFPKSPENINGGRLSAIVPPTAIEPPTGDYSRDHVNKPCDTYNSTKQ